MKQGKRYIKCYIIETYFRSIDHRMSERKHNNYLVIFTLWLQFTSRVDKVRAAQMRAWNSEVNKRRLVNTLSGSIKSKSMNSTFNWAIWIWWTQFQRMNLLNLWIFSWQLGQKWTISFNQPGILCIHNATDCNLPTEKKDPMIIIIIIIIMIAKNNRSRKKCSVVKEGLIKFIIFAKI